MKIVYEINVTEKQHKEIMMLRNQSFPKHQVSRSYFKQLPHIRALQYEGDVLIGYLGLDYRVIKVGNEVHRVLGVVDFCVAEHYRGQGLGTFMLSEISLFSEGKGVDFIILLSELQSFYSARGYIQVKETNSWLRLHEHTNYGVAVEHVDELYIKPMSAKTWGGGHIDWLGYMY